MRVRVVFTLLAAAAVVGCGPATPTDGTSTAKLEGIWIATKVDVPEGRTAFPQEDELEKLVTMVKENPVTVRMTTGGGKILLIQTEDAKTPRAHVTFETDEAWDIAPKKEVTFHTAGWKAGMKGPRSYPRGVLKVVGDTATVAIGAEPEVPSIRAEPKESAKSAEASAVTPADRAAMIVFHLKRVKDIPEPPPPRPAMRPTNPAQNTSK